MWSVGEAVRVTTDAQTRIDNQRIAVFISWFMATFKGAADSNWQKKRYVQESSQAVASEYLICKDVFKTLSWKTDLQEFACT